MSISEHDQILVVDDNRILLESLARRLRETGYIVITADAGEPAFSILREWPRRIGWLYSRAILPGLIDGWILADEYHDTHPHRAAIIAVRETRPLARDLVILEHPSPTTVLQMLYELIGATRSEQLPSGTDAAHRDRAA